MVMSPAIRWTGSALELLDQRLLPGEEVYLRYTTHQAVADAIRQMVVRGAPAIGITAAYGMALAALEAMDKNDPTGFLAGARETLAQSRPTAVNLIWALRRTDAVLANNKLAQNPLLLAQELSNEALAIHQQDIDANHRMGELGAALIAASGPCSVITHCNAGSLATGGYGTALGVIRSAHRQGLIETVYADETRPWLQGARLTAWELQQDAIPVCLIADVAAAQVMRSKNIGWVIVGADRIAVNGDTANKIGTYGLAILAKHHGVKVMVVAPVSTIDFALANGDGIPIEERAADEVRMFRSESVAPSGVAVLNPVFDVTPASLIDAIVTEKGVLVDPAKAGLWHWRPD